jgi:uncharacterized RDD family membrane protein YckC
MRNKILPVYLENSFERLYGNFGYRFAALLLETLILIPITLVVLFINNTNLNNYYYTLPLNFVLLLFYYVYLPVRYGATPGKMIMGLQILKLDGTPISYKESFLRYLPMFAISLISVLINLIGLLHADADTYNALPWVQKQQYIQSFTSPWNYINIGVINLVYFGSFIYYMLDDRNRSLSDVIGGTVVVKSNLIIDIEDWVEQNEVKE